MAVFMVSGVAQKGNETNLFTGILSADSDTNAKEKGLSKQNKACPSEKGWLHTVLAEELKKETLLQMARDAR